MRQKYAAFVLCTLALVAPALAEAAPKTFADLVNWTVGLIDILIPSIITLMIIYYMWAGYNSMREGSESFGDRAKVLGWGILILFLAVSIWGILQILYDSLKLTG